MARRFYNTTYTLFAASIILVYVMQEATEGEIPTLLRLVGKSIEILETMDECVVASKAAKMLHRALERAEKKFSAAANSTGPDSEGGDAFLHLNHYWGPLNFINGDMDLDFAFQLADFDGSNSLLMSLGDQPALQ
jgi:hypothetical protein